MTATAMFPGVDEAAAVPPDRPERARLRSAAQAYVLRHNLEPPLAAGVLHGHALRLAREAGADTCHGAFLGVLLGNALWRPMWQTVPYARRILLLPQCLRDERHCPAQMDELGLLCEACGRCPLGAFQEEAEALGYAVLIAEGTAAVTGLLERGEAEAVVGVGCLDALVRMFPCLETHAIPGLAIPLVRDGCSCTSVDIDWVWDAIRLRTDGNGPGIRSLAGFRKEVQGWFTFENLSVLAGLGDSWTERLALDWVAQGGNRWRPLMAACAFEAVSHAGRPEAAQGIRQIALAVECFHKASLIHDDIEDDDAERYGRPTLHRRFGIPIALNVGDLLLGEGYRLIAATDAPAACRNTMLQVAAEAHRNLCLGQGEELRRSRSGEVPSPLGVVDVFRWKTAPAFEVALCLGALYGGGDERVLDILRRFSVALGVAFQIRDDLEDFESGCWPEGARASLLTALVFHRCNPQEQQVFRSILNGHPCVPGTTRGFRARVSAAGAAAEASAMLERYRAEAVDLLASLQNTHLRILLRRILGKIFGAQQAAPAERPGRAFPAHGTAS